MSKNSDIGKYLKKLRIDFDETMSDMAEKLKVSVAFLSAVETGKRKIPSSMISKICDLYNLTSKEKDSFFESIALSGDRVEVYFIAGDDKRNNVAITLATEISNLTDDQLEEIKHILKNRRK